MQVFYNTYRQEKKPKSKTPGLLKDLEQIKFMLVGDKFDIQFLLLKKYLNFLKLIIK